MSNGNTNYTTLILSTLSIGHLIDIHSTLSKSLVENFHVSLTSKSFHSLVYALQNKDSMSKRHSNRRASRKINSPESATCVQRFNDSRKLAVHTTFRFLPRSSSSREPRYPPLRASFVNYNKLNVHWFDT